MEKLRFQYAALKWLQEMEMISDPDKDRVLINHLKLNVMSVSPRIKEVELLIYRENKSMLVLIELTWFGRRFQKKRIFSEVEDILVQMLPSFRFRVTDDPRIMELAVARVRRALTGGSHEVSNSSDSVSQSNSGIDSNRVDATEKTGVERSSSDPNSDREEQSETSATIQSETSPDDSGEKP